MIYEHVWGRGQIGTHTTMHRKGGEVVENRKQQTGFIHNLPSIFKFEKE